MDQIEKSLWLWESVWNGEYYTYRKSSRCGFSKLFFHFELNRNILQWKQNWSDVVEGQDTQSGLFPPDLETIKSYSDKPESNPSPSLREGRTITTTYNGLVTVRHFRLCGLLGWLFCQNTFHWPAVCELHVGWKKQNITRFGHKPQRSQNSTRIDRKLNSPQSQPCTSFQSEQWEMKYIQMDENKEEEKVGLGSSTRTTKRKTTKTRTQIWALGINNWLSTSHRNTFKWWLKRKWLQRCLNQSFCCCCCCVCFFFQTHLHKRSSGFQWGWTEFGQRRSRSARENRWGHWPPPSAHPGSSCQLRQRTPSSLCPLTTRTTTTNVYISIHLGTLFSVQNNSRTIDELRPSRNVTTAPCTLCVPVSLCPRLFVSPFLCVSVSLCPRFFVSPSLCVRWRFIYVAPYLCVAVTLTLT